MRTSGILLPIASLPSRYGIGAFSREAYRFVDFLERAGQKYWQILPLGPTGYGDSPYQSFSTFAGNPYFISLEDLAGDGLLTEKELESAREPEGNGVPYERLYRTRLTLLGAAYERFQTARRADPVLDGRYRAFLEENRDWLPDYCLYTAIKKDQEEASWLDWPHPLRDREEGALAARRERLAGEVDFYAFLQYLFADQWARLKCYANEKGIEIVGDLPIYVAMDSADAWACPELFAFEEGLPLKVAGCPPDAFTADGQLWGNPVYRWDRHRETGYEWWTRRVRRCLDLYDLVRIDHFRGFESYYAIPYGEDTARRGVWEKGPGLDFFRSLAKSLGELPLIAEDLGFLTDEVRDMVRETGYPGMKVLEFAFGGDPSNEYLPHNYGRNSIVYTGTHDNDTLVGWFEKLEERSRAYLLSYLGLDEEAETAIRADRVADGVIRLALASTADTCILPIQDWLLLGGWARINEPSTLGGNWEWRLGRTELTGELADRIRRLGAIYGRNWN